MSDDQPAIEDIKQLRLFNPACIRFISRDFKNYRATPGIKLVLAHELTTYAKVAEEMVALTGFLHTDVNAFWQIHGDRLHLWMQLLYLT